MDDSTQKICSKCGAGKPLSEFYRNARTPDGRNYACRSCESLVKRRRREAMTEDEAAIQRARHASNERNRYKRAGFKARQQAITVTAKQCSDCGVFKSRDEFSPDSTKITGLRGNCRPCAAERARLRWEQDKQKIRDRNREWYAANREYFQAKRQRPEIRERTRQRNQRFREANPTYAADYHAANREKTMERAQRRRAIQVGATIGRIDRQALWEACAGMCGICSESIDRTLQHPHPRSPSLDHIIPLSKGGAHSQENLQWTCLVCNLSKGARLPE